MAGYFRYNSAGQLTDTQTGALYGGGGFGQPPNPAAQALKTRSTNLATNLANQEGLAKAEVDADATDYEVSQNRERGNRYFQAAMARANTRRPVGGGLYHGKMSFNSFTGGGGLARANADARKKSKLSLALARLRADPSNTAMREQQSTIKDVSANPALAQVAGSGLLEQQLKSIMGVS